MNENEKLSRFAKAVNDETSEKVSQIIAAAENERKRLVEEVQRVSHDDAHDKVFSSVNKITGKYAKAVAKEELEAKKEVLVRIDELTRELFVNVKLRLSAYRHEPEYAKYLAQTVSRENPLPRCVINLMPEDMQHADFIKSTSGTLCEIKPDASIRLGGLTIFDKQRGVITDFTFDSAVEEKRRGFSANSPFAPSRISPEK